MTLTDPVIQQARDILMSKDWTHPKGGRSDQRVIVHNVYDLNSVELLKEAIVDEVSLHTKGYKPIVEVNNSRTKMSITLNERALRQVQKALWEEHAKQTGEPIPDFVQGNKTNHVKRIYREDYEEERNRNSWNQGM